MTREFADITYPTALTPPVETQAFHAQDDGEWRVIVVPGTPGNRLLYMRFLRTAPRGVDMVVVQRLGFGRGHDRAYTNFDDQLQAVKPFLGEKKTIVLGVSYGGELALKTALDFPDLVQGVVTVSALIDEPHDYALQLEKLGGDPGLEPFVPNRWRKVREEVAGRRTQIGPILERVKNLSVPVEIIHGDFDAIVPKSNALVLQEAFAGNPFVNLDIVPGGTHYLELQYPRRLHNAVQRVIERAETKMEVRMRESAAL